MGALGRSAYEGGAKTAALGLGFHFLIALIAATVYFLASRVLRFMVTRPIISGILYGLGVYMFGIGLPIALAVRKFSR